MSEPQFVQADIGRGSSPINFDLVEVAGILWRAKFRIMLTALVGLVIGIYISIIMPKSYVAQGEVVVRAEATVTPDVDRAFSATAINEAVVATERSVLAAEGLMSRVSEQVTFPTNALAPSWISVQIMRVRQLLNLPPAPPTDVGREERAAKLAYLKKSVSTVVEKGSSVITVVASTGDPTFSASIVNSLLGDYMVDRVVAQKAAARNVETALQERQRQTIEQIGVTQQKIADLMQLPGLIEGSEIPGQQRDLAALSGQLSLARRDADEKRAAYDAIIQLRNQAGGDPARLAEMLDNGSQSTSELRRQYVQKEQELNGLIARFGSDYPQIAVVRSQLASLSSGMRGEGLRIVAQRKAEFDAAAQVAEALSARFRKVRNTTATDSSVTLQLLRARENLANLQRIGNNIEDRLLAVTSQPVDANARILTDAVMPLVAAFPNKALLAVIGAVLGLVIASVTILFRGFKRHIRPSAISQASLLSDTLLGCLPLLSSARNVNAAVLPAPGRRLGRKARLLSLAFDGAALELDTTVHANSYKIVAVTSALPQEGKTTVVDALAARLTQLGRKVLLINCDLHVGTRRFEAERHIVTLSSGRTANLLRRTSMQDEIELPMVDNPVAYLQSAEFREILEFARKEYDIVLCDTPPTLSVPDPLIVTRLADAVVLVSEYRPMAEKLDINEFLRRIRLTRTPVCGVILTKVEKEEAGFATYLGYEPVRPRHLAISSAR